jgi:hypothetical protein
MQKVEGSSPFSRFVEPSVGLSETPHRSRAHCSRDRHAEAITARFSNESLRKGFLTIPDHSL